MKNSGKNKIILVSSIPDSLVLFRGNLIKSLINLNFEVHALAPNLTKSRYFLDKINSYGAIAHDIPLKSSLISPVNDILLLIRLSKLFLQIKPDIVLSYNIKPVVFGTLVARIFRVKKIYAIITGVGFYFTDQKNKSFKKIFIKKIITVLYKISFKILDKIFFQNKDDLNLFKKNFNISQKKSILINGSGVDVSYYKFSQLPKKMSFLMISRLIKSKGIVEYLEAAKIIKSKYPLIKFHLVGYIDDNVDSISRNLLEEFIQKEIIVFYGKINDVRQKIIDSKVYVLPSYREGTPRSVLEAMSIGRPIISTDVPGCKETVFNEINGFKIRSKSVKDLVSAMEKMINLPNDQLQKMGIQSRRIAETKFDDNIINRKIIQNINL